jgi:hypothetical protein
MARVIGAKTASTGYTESCLRVVLLGVCDRSAAAWRRQKISGYIKGRSVPRFRSFPSGRRAPRWPWGRTAASAGTAQAQADSTFLKDRMAQTTGKKAKANKMNVYQASKRQRHKLRNKRSKRKSDSCSLPGLGGIRHQQRVGGSEV